MVNMTYQTTSDSLQIREKLNQLMSKRTDLEGELQVYQGILSSNNVGLQESLVDGEGYPRQDLDVFQVRHARNRIICIQNDLRGIMKEIEENIHLVHSIDGASSQVTHNSRSIANGFTGTPTPALFNPIARIGDVVPNSPAFKAGLEKDDVILEFGPVNSSNFKSLQDFAGIVRSNVNQDIVLIVLRTGGTRQRLVLRPQPFNGQGLVGCYFLNVENVER
uniref:26S proteasome non-ATPase regulatory subunit 9 n=1 Tax=Cacopsylla melanoneura TaxID=428564 RepID=A0A8D8WBL3_9HEMI